METKELLETNWLNATNTQDEDKVVVVSEGELREQQGTQGKYMQLILLVQYQEKNKLLGLSKASHKAIAERYGSETKHWIGKVLQLNHVKTDKIENGKPKYKLSVTLPE